MKHLEGAFTGREKLELFYQGWIPGAGKPRAVVGIVHGFGEHSGRYGNVVGPFVEKGFAVYGYDLRGHGRSPGQRGHIDSWEDYREDANAFFNTLKNLQAGVPLFLYAHSLGALIGLDYLLYHAEGLRGAIISGSATQPAGVAKPHLILLVRVLSGVVPRFAITLPLEHAALSRNPEVISAYGNDPLVHGLASARWGAENLKAIEWIKARAPEIRTPILLIHGEADRINLVDGSRQLFESLTVKDKTLLVYPETYHEAHNDLNHRKVVEDMANWIEKRI